MHVMISLVHSGLIRHVVVLAAAAVVVAAAAVVDASHNKRPPKCRLSRKTTKPDPYHHFHFYTLNQS
jgi:hypothetical protein